MQGLVLVRIQEPSGAFSQYIPKSFHHLLKKPETVCVGAIYDGKACAAALAESQSAGSYYLRYLFVDPAARLCGLGTYLLRGLLGEVKAAGAQEIKAVYSPSMLGEGKQTLSVLTRAGFSSPKPISTAFSVRLGDIPNVNLSLPANMAVYSAVDAPEPVQLAYQALVEGDKLPSYANAERLKAPVPELCSFSTVTDCLSGVLLIDHREEGYHIAGLYVLEPFRGGWSAAALIARTLTAARAMLPDEAEVWTSAIDRGGFSLCDKLLRQGKDTRKETEFYAVYRF